MIVDQNTLGAVIVSFNTDIEKLRNLIRKLAEKATPIVADNSLNPSHASEIEKLVKAESAHYISMHGNVGIGKAQNAGIVFAKSLGCEYVILMDDDSLPANDMIDQLFSALELKSAEIGSQVIVCPRPIDYEIEVEDKEGRISTMTECHDMMSSGTLIPMRVFEKIGYFDEKLFIDFVDFDWGWRFRAKNGRIFIVENAYLFHKLGVNDQQVFGLRVRVPSSIRHYFQVRNVFHMFGRSHTPLKWKVGRLTLLPVKLILLFIFSDQKRNRLKYATRGFLDGCKKISGPYIDH